MDKRKVKGFLKKNRNKIVLIALAIILVVVLIQGYQGGKETKRVSQICDIGFEGVLCWKWRQATDQEMLEELFGGNPKFLESAKNWLNSRG